MLLWILTSFFLIGYGVLIFYYYHHWKGLKEQAIETNTALVFISVIVAARNEEKNIPLLLQALQHQTYPKHLFEIIIVDDFSTDKTAAVVQQAPIPNLHLIQPPESSTSSKKRAIEAGITCAKGELMVITDADCIMEREWLQTIASFYVTKQSVFIAAPVKFYHNNSVLQIFQALDFITLQGITAASVSAGFHTMCNGANLAYTKKAFIEVNGFSGIDKVASGDDMLLMYKIWERYPNNVHYLKSRQVVVTTQPMHTWSDFIMQRRRWASKTLYYDDYRVLTVLAFVYLFNVLFFVLLVAGLFDSYYWWILLVYLLGKTLIEAPFVYAVAAFYEEKNLMRYFPFFQPLHILYTVSIGLLSQLGKYQWKGRTTK